MDRADRLPLASACPYPAWKPPVRVELTVLPEHPCSYLPDRLAQMRGFWAREIDPEIYKSLMDSGFRRSGRLVYQPICKGCRACLPLRVPVARFTPNKSQRRCWGKNQDIVVSVGPLQSTDEKWLLYQKYVTGWHLQEPSDRVGFEEFLYTTPVNTVEFSYRDASGRLIAVGVCDVSEGALSSVYFYFDPEESERGLGTYGALVEIDWAKQKSVAHYYLGYWVDRCKKMSYKRSYRAHEILHPDNVWRPG